MHKKKHRSPLHGTGSQRSTQSDPMCPEVPITRVPSNAYRDVKDSQSELPERNPFLPNPPFWNGPPAVPNDGQFPRQYVTFTPPVASYRGPHELYGNHSGGYFRPRMPTADPRYSQPYRSHNIDHAREQWRLSDPYFQDLTSEPEFNPSVQRNLSERRVHSPHPSSPFLSQERKQGSQRHRKSKELSRAWTLQSGDQHSGRRSHSRSPDRPGNVGPDEASLSSSALNGTGFTLPSRMTTSSIPTSIGEVPFQYRPIQATEFRLVRLLPANMSMIKCEILHASLEAEPQTLKYIAVSYTWGDVDPNIKIQVDGYPFYITPNLYGALKRLRKQHRSVMVWVDALCINQRNKEEQSQQVALMTKIYGRAQSVAAWLGPELDGSRQAFELIQEIFDQEDSNSVSDIIADKQWRPHFTAVVNLFERDFWSRLWIVQEILNAKSVYFYCGDSEVTWHVLQSVSAIFKRHEADIKYHFPRGMKGSRQGLSYAHTLVSQGPASLSILKPQPEEGPESLLEVLRICRTKLAAEPRDKVFGVLGILPESVQYHFPPDYNASLREVYTNVVDLLLHTTRRVDVICNAIYFPLYTRTVKLPTWVPDWSHIPSTAPLGPSYDFSAASDIDADFDFLDPAQRTKLKISAISIDTLKTRGNPVGTFCTLDDYLMAFLHWQAGPFASLVADEDDAEILKQKDEAFCRTLVLGKTPGSLGASAWMRTCYYVFASLISERLPSIGLTDRLQKHVAQIDGIKPGERRMILQNNCALKMEGRCFFITESGLMGMGSGFMKSGDTICVPLGCKTPIVLRQDGNDEYRLVGDAYVDGYMTGKAVKEWRDGKRTLENYVLH
ncbi:heterokaryon incompatibility protein-domain-containing protein [Xylaria sp. FL1042]|nr:heterokaryon incompatibility protein-domain-containing protein [Xylaria sp. FL1042]